MRRHPVHPPGRELGLEGTASDCLRPGPLEQVPQALELGRRGLHGERARMPARRSDGARSRSTVATLPQPAAFAGYRTRSRATTSGVATRIRPDGVVRSSTGAAAAVPRTTNSITSRPVRTGRRGRGVTTWTTCAAWPEAPWMDAAVRRPT